MAQGNQKKNQRSTKFVPKPRGQKKGRINIPKPVQQRVMASHIQGKSNRQISEEEDISNPSVAKIIKSAEMVAFVEECQGEILGLAKLAIKSVRFKLKTEETGDMGIRVIEKLQLFPPEEKTIEGPIDATQILDTQSETEEAKEERAIRGWCAKLAFVAHERHKVFRTPMPEMDEIIAETKGK